MADIHVDDERLAELLAQAVKEMLANEESRLHKLSDGFLEDATKARRDALKDFDESRDKFETKAREKLVEADAAIVAFNTSLAEKKKRVEDALNLRVIGGFSAIMILAAIGAIALLGERVLAVNTKAGELSAAAAILSKSSTDLQASIMTANEVYKTVAASAKGTDPTSQLQTLNILTTRMNEDLKKLGGQVQKATEDMKPLLADYASRHPQKK